MQSEARGLGASGDILDKVESGFKLKHLAGMWLLRLCQAVFLLWNISFKYWAGGWV
jgi:hypothetical protein